MVISSAWPELVRGFFESTYYYKPPADRVANLAQQLGFAGVDGATFALVESAHRPAVTKYLRATHRLAAARPADYLLQVLLKRPVVDLMESVDLTNEVSAAGLNPSLTRHLYPSYLGRAEFELGRSLDRQDRDVADRFLEWADVHLRSALEAASGPELTRASRYACGMLGVTNLFLRRKGGLARLRASVHYLERAEAAGDRSPEHFRHLGEAYLEMADFEPDRGHIEAAASALKASRDQSEFRSEVESLYGQATYRLGVKLVHARELAAADQFLREAEAALERSLARPPVDYDISGLLGRLGNARVYRWWTTSDIEAVESGANLLREAAQRNPSWNRPLALSLLILARQSRGNVSSQLDEALKAIDKFEDEPRFMEESSKLRGRILLAKGVNDQREELLSGAIDHFEAGDATNDPELSYYLGTAYAHRGILSGQVADLEAAHYLLQDQVRTDDSDADGPGTYPRVCSALARLIEDAEPERALALFSKSIRRTAAYADASESPGLLALVAGGYFHRYRLGRSIGDLHAARSYFERALRAGAEGVEFFGLLGDCTLQVAKNESDDNRREELLRASIEYLLQSGSFGSVAHAHASKVGEAYLRLGRLIRDRQMLAEAASWLTRSKEQGNESGENYGLLGDAYYFLSRFGEQRENLRNALRYKEESRKRLDPSREHFSQVGRLHHLLYDIEGREDDLMQAVSFVATAAALDPSWPWPLCQLAQLAEQFPQATAFPVRQIDEFDLPGAWEATNTSALWKRAAHLILETDEVRRKILGGKSNAWIAVDPLGLLESVFVFKPAAPGPALAGTKRLKAEVNQIELVENLIRRHNLAGIETVRVVDVFEAQRRPVLAMRRSVGRTLNDVLRHGGDGGIHALRAALSFLALYHAEISPVAAETNVLRLRNHIRSLGDRLAGDRTAIDRAIRGSRRLLDSLPAVAKKDAHGQNWLVRWDGGLVVLDIEAPQPRYLIEEVPQLLDDVEVFTIADAAEGLSARRDLLRAYLNSYEQAIGTDLDMDDKILQDGYLFFAMLHSLNGISVALNRRAAAMSWSGQEHWEACLDWYVRLLRFLRSAAAASGSSPEIDWERVTMIAEAAASRGVGNVQPQEGDQPAETGYAGMSED